LAFFMSQYPFRADAEPGSSPKHSWRPGFPPGIHHGCRLVWPEVGPAGTGRASVREIERRWSECAFRPHRGGDGAGEA
jgi:hypothetical protein